MNLYIIRHGKTDANKNNLIVGHTDYPINIEGIKEANHAKEIIKEIEYDYIITSPLLRTKQTAQIINIKNKPIIIENQIIERNCGIFEGKKWENNNFLPYCNYYQNLKLEQGETVQELFKRVYSFLENIKKENKNIIIVTHLGVSRAITSYFKGIPDDGDLSIYKHKNCEILKYTINT